jgi:hypothetical protein
MKRAVKDENMTDLKNRLRDDNPEEMPEICPPFENSPRPELWAIPKRQARQKA